MSTAFSHEIRRGKILVTFASLEMLNKILMFVVGITVVRNVAKADYAWYTIANSMFGGMAMLSTLGVTIGLVSMEGERFGDRAAIDLSIPTRCVSEGFLEYSHQSPPTDNCQLPTLLFH